MCALVEFLEKQDAATLDESSSVQDASFADLTQAGPGGAPNLEDCNELSTFRNIDETANLARMRYASGQVFIPSTAPVLLCREHQIPGILGLVQAVIGYRRGSSPMLRQYSVPSSFNERPYLDLFRKVMEMSGLPVGLYRSGRAPVILNPFAGNPKSPLERLSSANSVADSRASVSAKPPPAGLKARNSLPWVFTNPPPDTIVSSLDAVFVIAQDFTVLDRYFASVVTHRSFDL
mmetsp:Transcript_26844/g.65294  ORF Transcript_26844/g.65294 Transcript_26844/m.65294 type:complete len:234 (-) Transcript_26844:137-838(-)